MCIRDRCRRRLRKGHELYDGDGDNDGQGKSDGTVNEQLSVD